MSIRESEEYKNMTPYRACSVAEGFCEGEGADQNEQAAAWQYISDTGIWRHLQGFYGRNVMNLLDSGMIDPPINRSV
jgi:hypothetical protein